jgi:hypothetical protein
VTISQDSGASRPRISAGGFAATIVAMVMFVIWWGVLEFGALFLGFVSDACGEDTACNLTQLQIGSIVAIFGTAAVGVATLVITIVLLVRRRRFAWLWPIAGAAVATVLWYVAATVTYAAVGQTFPL